MKKLGLFLAGVLCLSVVGYAGEVITNDTGEDATGFRVSFLAPVLITAFGDILTSVDPQMLSFEFVFSGGTVKPWESHWFSYVPTSAQVMETEWLTGTQASQIPTGDLTHEDLLNYRRALQVGDVLQASISQPYRKINDLWDEARDATSLVALAELDRKAREWYSNLNYARLQRLAMAVIEYIQLRMEETPDTKLGDIGYMRDLRFTTAAEVEDLTAKYDELSVSIDTEPGRVIAQLKTLAGQLNVRYHNSEDVVIRAQIAILMTMVEEEIAKRSLIDGFEMTYESIRDLWIQYSAASRALKLEWDADPTSEIIMKRAVGIQISVTELMGVASMYNVMFADVYINNILERLEPILKEAGAEIPWTSLIDMIIEGTKLLQKSADDRERLMSEFFLITGSERPGDATRRFFWATPTMDLEDFEQDLELSEWGAITPPDFGEGTDVDTTFTTVEPTAPAPEFSTFTESIDSVEALKEKLRATESTFYPRTVRNSLEVLAGQLTDLQADAVSDWITSLMASSLLIEQQWQILWDYIVGARVSSFGVTWGGSGLLSWCYLL